MIDILYKNHPTLDPIYKNLFEIIPDLMHYTMQIEVSDRLGKVTMGICLNKLFQPELVVFHILNFFKNIVTKDQIEVFEKLIMRDKNCEMIAINPDKYNNILRYYYQRNLKVYGHDIQPDGEISRSKSYSFSPEDEEVKTVHKYPDGNKKINYSKINRNVSELPDNCCMTLTRDDGHIYYIYQTS